MTGRTGRKLSLSLIPTWRRLQLAVWEWLVMKLIIVRGKGVANYEPAPCIRQTGWRLEPAPREMSPILPLPLPGFYPSFTHSPLERSPILIRSLSLSATWQQKHRSVLRVSFGEISSILANKGWFLDKPRASCKSSTRTTTIILYRTDVNWFTANASM